jgi:hypothetical protein
MTNDDYLPKLAIALALLAGIALDGAVTSTLHAQVQPAVYSVDQAFGDVDLTGTSEYMHDYVPIAQASIKAYGGKVLAESSTVTTFSCSTTVWTYKNVDAVVKDKLCPLPITQNIFDSNFSEFHLTVS